MKTKAFVETLILLLIFSLGIILFTTPKHIKLYNQDYLSNTRILNLSNVKINSLDELNNNIDKFNHLKEVDLGNNANINIDSLQNDNSISSEMANDVIGQEETSNKYKEELNDIENNLNLDDLNKMDIDTI